VFGPICIVIAIAMFVESAKDPRDHHIASYDSAVDLWTGGEYQAFADLQAAFAVYDDLGVLHVMNNVTLPDPIDDSGKNIHTYPGEYLRYVYSGSLLTSTSGSGTLTLLNVGTGDEHEIGFSTIYHTYESKSSLSCSCSSSTTSSSSSGCYGGYYTSQCGYNCLVRGGQWDGYDCNFIQYVSAICVKVDDDGTFAIGGDLCYDPEYNTAKTADSTSSYYPMAGRTFSVTLRSAYDPFIKLYTVTYGTLDFGLTAGEYATIGIVFIVVGGLCVAANVAVIMLACALGKCAWKRL